MQNVGKLSVEELHAYVVENIDRAISEHFIKVYYQPIVRTLTGEVCAMEALARWDDPLYGLLAPDVFIGALEESRQIHKLDICIVEKICENYASLLGKGEHAVTVSFNLSRLDFELCNIQKKIEEAVHKYEVPKSALRVEITESTMENSAMRMHEVIDSFWERGLRVWMDDFGSGFSSLNVLKDYRFDTLKIDMIFMRNFNKRSKEIVKSVVDMAKRIGVHTLAEGVETQEQMQFLRNIGCEKAQGYFIGKPLPYRQCLAHLEEKGYVFELPNKRQYYHDIGCVNVLSATPFLSVRDNETDMEMREQQRAVAIVELRGRELHYLFANETYLDTLRGIGILSTREIEQDFKNGNSVFGEKLLGMMRRADRTGNVESVDFQRGRNYCYAQVKKIASYQEGTAYLCMLHNLSRDSMNIRNKNLSEYMASIYSIYERIELVELESGMSKTLFQSAQTIETYNRLPAAEELRIFAEQEIYSEDRGHFLDFVDLNTLEERMEQSAVGFLTAPFRTRTENGHYIWELYIWLYAGTRIERKFLCCCRRVENELVAKMYTVELQEISQSKITPELLWNNFELNADTAFFWKDRERRFLGANRRFLDYYGLESADSLIGKTDEDVGWHIDPEPYKRDEEDVIEKGIQTHLVPGNCICKGENRDIVASKMPLYDQGKIIGLMGYFFDVTDWIMRDQEFTSLSLKDARTDTLNFIGIMEAARRYEDSYVFERTDFVLIYFNLVHFNGFNRDYGKSWGNELLRCFAQRLRDAIGQRGVTGRMAADHFLILMQCVGERDVEEILEYVQREVAKIHAVGDIPYTVYYHTGYAFYSETEELQRLVDLAKDRADNESE